MHEDDTFDDLESIADVSEHPSKRQRQKTANACTMCGAPNKYVKEAGIHTKAGWCGPSQEFSIRKSNDDRPSAGERLRKLKTRVQVEQDEDAAALLQAVRAGHVDGVTARLKARPELMLMPVWGVSRKDPSRPLWEWSVLHEALNKVGDGPSSVGVVKALLQHCGRNGVLLTTLRPKSDSWATPLHEAAYRGSICCIELLLAAGADLFAKTRSDWPIHNVCVRHAPAYIHSATLVPWFLERMRDEHPEGESMVLEIPRGFKEEHNCDMDLLAHVSRQRVRASAGGSGAIPVAAAPVP